MPDRRKTLEVLRAEWESCVECDLGIRRESHGKNFVFGEGRPRAIMFVGGGPCEREEDMGRQFVGDSGQILRHLLKTFGVEEYYLTGIVACRPASQRTDGNGEPIFRKQRTGPPLPMWKDELPLPPQVNACKPRIHEEIYLVDPVVIVTLGSTATEALLGKPVAITKNRGEPERLVIPGASFVPVLTEKRRAWFRKQAGQWVAPVEQNEVSYFCIPTLDLSYVRKKLADRGPSSPFAQLASDIRLAVKVYEEWALMAFGRVPGGLSDAPTDELQAGLGPGVEEDEATP